MKTKKDFLRFEGLFVNNEEMKAIIRECLLELTGWEFDNMEHFLKLIGVKTKVDHGTFFMTNKSVFFIYVSDQNSKCEIEINFAECEEQNGEVLIYVRQEVEDIFRSYSIECKGEKEKKKPLLIINRRIIEQNQKRLECEYFQDKIVWKLKIDNEHTLEVQIRKHTGFPKNNVYNVMQDCTDYESYLLSLNNYLKVPEVYDKMIQLLNVSKDDVVGCIQFTTSVKKQF